MAADVLQIIQIVSSSILIIYHFYESTTIFNVYNSGTFMEMLLRAIPLAFFAYIPLLLSFIKWDNLFYNIIICFLSYQLGFYFCMQFSTSYSKCAAFFMIHPNIPNFLTFCGLSIALLAIVLAYSISLIKSAYYIVNRKNEERYVQIKNRDEN